MIWWYRKNHSDICFDWNLKWQFQWYIFFDSLSEMKDHDRTCDESFTDISILCLFLFVYTCFKTLLPITSPHSSNTETPSSWPLAKHQSDSKSCPRSCQGQRSASAIPRPGHISPHKCLRMHPVAAALDKAWNFIGPVGGDPTVRRSPKVC